MAIVRIDSGRALILIHDVHIIVQAKAIFGHHVQSIVKSAFAIIIPAGGEPGLTMKWHALRRIRLIKAIIVGLRYACILFLRLVLHIHWVK